MHTRYRVVVLCTLSLLVAATAQAAVLTVNSTADDGGPSCLRWCIEHAQAGDEIQFDPSLDGQAIVLAAGELVIDKDLTITGRGPVETVLDADGESRVLYVRAARTVAISGVTIKTGMAREGAGIYNAGTLTVHGSTITSNMGLVRGGGIRNYRGNLTVSHSTISGNYGPFGGGGISNAGGTLRVDHSIISGNSAWHYGGGIANGDGTLTVNHSTINHNSVIYSHSYPRGGGGIHSKGATTIRYSTISGNSGPRLGGGIYQRTGSLTVDNSTISGNSAWYYGGGIYYHESDERWRCGTLTVSHSTIRGNSAMVQGGGIYTAKRCRLPGDPQARRKLSNSVIADQSAGRDCRGEAVTSLGHNLDSDGSCGFDQPSDQPDTDPELGLLQDNGGPTWTHAPLEASPLIDRGWCDSATDQRGVPRPLDGNRDNVWICDIGAVEYNPFLVEVVGPGGEVILVPPPSE